MFARKYQNKIVLGLSTITIFIGVVLALRVSALTNGTNAIDLIGQYVGGNLAIPDYTASNTATTATGFSLPQGVAFDSVHHRLFIAETNNSRVLVFNLNSSNQLVDKTADNVLGQANFTASVSTTTQSGLTSLVGLAYDSNNDRLFVVDNGSARVMVYDTALISNGENAINVLGQSSFTASVSTTTASGMASPRGIAYDSVHSRLFVSDNIKNRVTVFNVASISDGEPAVNVLGQTLFTVGTSGTTQLKLQAPFGLAYDPSGDRLFVADAFNNRVMVYDTASISDGEPAVNVLGQTTFLASGGGNTQLGINFPIGVTFDSVHNRLFVSESSGNRVKIWDTASISDGEPAVNVLGQINFSGSSGADTQSGLNAPVYSAYDSGNDRLYVSEQNGNRVKVFDVSTVDVTGPVISSISSSNVTPISATLSFLTDESATSTLQYGIDTSYGSIVSSPMLATSTSYFLSGLNESTTYHFKITASDSLGNISTSSDQTFTTATPPATGGGGGQGGNFQAGTNGPVAPPIVPQPTPTPALPTPTVPVVLVTPVPVIPPIVPPEVVFVPKQNLSYHAVSKEVFSLQQYLNEHGFIVSKTGAGSIGHETTFFGPATYKALVKFQKAVGIKPASGFFGPITRAYINAHN